MSEDLEDLKVEIQTREVIYRINTVYLGEIAEFLNRHPEDVLIDIETGIWDEIEDFALVHESDSSEQENDWGLDTVEIL